MRGVLQPHRRAALPDLPGHAPRPRPDLRGRGAERRDPDGAHARVPRRLPRARRRALADRRRRSRGPEDRRAAGRASYRARVREVVLATNPTTTGEATALHIAEELRDRARSVTVTRLASGLPVGRRPGVRRRGHARQGARRPARRLTAISCAVMDGPDRDEVRRHLGGRRGADQARRPADRGQARTRQPRGRRALGARQDDRRADRDGRGGLLGAGPARDGHAALDRRAHLLRAVRDGDQRPRPPRDLADRLPGGDRDGRVAHQGAASSTCVPSASRRRSRRIRSCWWRASRASRAPPATSPRSGRGGSDTTAVAVAAALGAEVCEIYTDVSGVFTADPRIVPDARKLDTVSFEEMLEMAASGRRRAAAALGRVRAQPWRAHPLPLVIRRRARYRSARRRRDDGAATHHSRHALDRRGAPHARRRARRDRAPPRASSRRSPRSTSTST